VKNIIAVYHQSVARINMGKSQVLLKIEFAVLFFLLPLFYAFNRESSPILLLLVLSFSTFFILYKDPSFDSRKFINIYSMKPHMKKMLTAFLLTALGATLFVAYFLPEYLFFCIKKDFWLWCYIMLIYPALSVYPQELIYRGFFFHRYGQLFKSENTLITMSAVSFSFAHVIYFHPVSVFLTLIGGFIFALTYHKTKSILAASIEHALYGCLLYTIGLGRFFYTGFDKLIN